MKSFESWTYEEVEDSFDIQNAENLLLLSEWLSAIYTPTERETENLKDLQQKFRKQVLAWNEDELKMFFIGPIIGMVNLETEYFKPFTQRSFSVEIQDIKIGGRVDFLIAKGKKRPKFPFFCLHEYKQENNQSDDPLGQLLISMVAAQALNEKEMPILGTYISGRNWFFVVLVGKEYAVSKEFDATDEDLFQIFAILQKSKEIMMRYI